MLRSQVPGLPRKTAGGCLSDLHPVVFVVDDDVSVRTVLSTLLRSAGYRVACFGSADEFMSSSSRDAPGCLVLDARMPGTTGLELQRHLVESGADMPVVFISGYTDIRTTVRAMKAGAVEFLAKPFDEQELLDAVESALGQLCEAWRDRALRAALHARFEQLTNRERQVLGLVVEGRLNKQIAAGLGIAEVTVKIHRARVMQKMEATSLAALVRMCEGLDQLKNPRP